MFTAKHFSEFFRKFEKLSKIVIARLEIERNGRNWGSHVLSMFTVKHFKKNNLRIQSLGNNYGNALHRRKNRLINAKYTWRSLVFLVPEESPLH